MSSAAQIEANHANAQLSTGPVTLPGKQASSQNATTHGLYSKHAVLLNEQEHHQFQSLRNSYVYQFNPAGIVEVNLLDLLVLSAWNIERTNRLEAGLATAEGIDPLLSETHAKTLDRITTYRVRAERTFHKCLKELRTLTALRPKPVQAKQLAAVPKEMRNEPKLVNPTPTHDEPGLKIGRNELCPCKSGRKYKQCCLRNEANFTSPSEAVNAFQV